MKKIKEVILLSLFAAIMIIPAATAYSPGYYHEASDLKDQINNYNATKAQRVDALAQSCATAQSEIGTVYWTRFRQKSSSLYYCDALVGSKYFSSRGAVWGAYFFSNGKVNIFTLFSQDGNTFKHKFEFANLN